MKPLAKLSGQDQGWMAYVDAEVAAVCRMKGWRRQIRRKWAVRSKPLSRSHINDYEWKLVVTREPEVSNPASEEPGVSEHPLEFEEGTYFVLGLVSSKKVFVLQHDTSHCGVMGDHWFTRTYTEIDLGAAWKMETMRGFLTKGDAATNLPPRLSGLPPKGLLQRLLLPLVDEFKPNEFCIT